MEALMAFLTIALYVLGIALLVVLIILGIKLIYLVDRANVVVGDIEKKTQSLNKLFDVIDGVTDTLSYLSDTVVDAVVSGLSRIFPKRKKYKKKEEELENE